MSEFLTDDAVIGIIIASVLIALIIMPMCCSQISNEEYARILARMKEKKAILEKQRLEHLH
jgi:hypothetical protein